MHNWEAVALQNIHKLLWSPQVSCLSTGGLRRQTLKNSLGWDLDIPIKVLYFQCAYMWSLERKRTQTRRSDESICVSVSLIESQFVTMWRTQNVWLWTKQLREPWSVIDPTPPAKVKLQSKEANGSHFIMVFCMKPPKNWTHNPQVSGWTHFTTRPQSWSSEYSPQRQTAQAPTN